MADESENLRKLKSILAKFADLIREAEGTSDPILVADMREKVAEMDIAKFTITSGNGIAGYTLVNGSADPSVPEDTLDYYRKLLTNFADKVRVGSEKLDVDEIEDQEDLVCGVDIVNNTYGIRLPSKSSISYVEYNAFSNDNALSSVTINNNITIKEYAFQNCTSLKKLIIPEGSAYFSYTEYKKPFKNCPVEELTTVGSWQLTSVFKDTLKRVTVTKGADVSFKQYSQLENVTLLNSVSSINALAFSDCTKLTSIVLPNGIPSIPAQAFYRCFALQNIIIPNSVKSIGESAFWGCIGLTSVTIGNSVESIGNSAFYGCTGLTSVTIPDSVTSIYTDAFNTCGLTSVTIGNSVTSIDTRAFYHCDGLTSVTIPDSVTSIGPQVFEDCDGLISLTIGNSVTSVGSSAFIGCSGLTSVTIPDSVTSIGYSAFSGCSGLTSLTIGNSVAIISESAFSGCSALTSLTIPNSITSIEHMAFYSCSGLESVSYLGTVDKCDQIIGPDAFGNTNITVIHCTDGDYEIPSGGGSGSGSGSGNGEFNSNIGDIETSFNITSYNPISYTSSFDYYGETKYYELNVSESNNYYIYLESDSNSSGILYYSDGYELANDGGDNGAGINFCISYYLEDGYTYYLAVTARTDPPVGDFTLHITTEGPSEN